MKKILTVLMTVLIICLVTGCMEEEEVSVFQPVNDPFYPAENWFAVKKYTKNIQFEYEASGSMSTAYVGDLAIIVDNETGCHYIVNVETDSGGISPYLDQNGQPICGTNKISTPIEQLTKGESPLDQ